MIAAQVTIERELLAQTAQVARLTEALRELVACKDLKDAVLRGESGDPATDYAAYVRRKPLAWEAARAALASCTPEGGS
jgi:hypothetical protein